MPFCMMGACYDCLVEIDGRIVQACMRPATDGLIVKRTTNLFESNIDSGSENSERRNTAIENPMLGPVHGNGEIE